MRIFRAPFSYSTTSAITLTSKAKQLKAELFSDLTSHSIIASRPTYIALQGYLLN